MYLGRDEDAGPPGRKLTDDPGLLPLLLKPLQGSGRGSSTYYQDESYAHVKGPEHLLLIHSPPLLDLAEDPRHPPGPLMDDGTQSLGQHARDVVVEASARDVNHGMEYNAISQS